MEQVPRGVHVRIEAEPPNDDAYRRGDPDPGRLIIVHRWRDSSQEYLTGHAIGSVAWWIWVAWTFRGLLQLDPHESFLYWLAYPGWFVLFVAGVLIALDLAKHLWNKTTITVDAQRLVVRHGPIPTLANREVRLDQLDRLHCNDDQRPEDERTPGLVARLQSGTEVELLTGARDPEVCRFAAGQITSYLEHKGNRE